MESHDKIQNGAIRLKIGNTFQYVRWDRISHISIEDHYSRIHLQSDVGSKEIYRKISLKNMMAMLPGDQFLQIHRSHVVNIAFVIGLKKSRRSHEVVLKDIDDALPISRHRLVRLRPILMQQIVQATH